MEPRPVVLIVDDLPSNVLVMGEALAGECEVLFATSGAEALEIAGRIPPDLVLLDVVMPGMDGFEVCRRLKAEERLAGVPILFLTTQGEEDDAAKGFEAGAVDYLTKPVNPSLVKARVRNHLRMKRLYDRERHLVEELREALARVQELQGLLPLCAWCKKVRNDQGYWEQLETYVSRHSGATWTHGICPECAARIREAPREAAIE
ncbi:MAG: response regulator [Acidobacteria bacterium]|nr:response regulator [Acidobacteriota bacterium]